ncbi:MAG: copper resistance protein B [Rhodospirillaceae bacterium]|nr:MAG: copper resistance protein B [Rhodospirillaceae bacterium]
MTIRAVLIGAAVGLTFSSLAARAQMIHGGPGPSASMGEMGEDQQVWVHGILDQFEARVASGNTSLRWQGEAWLGNDDYRIRLKSEGERTTSGVVTDGQQEIYYARPVSPFFDIQIGARYDLDSLRGRGWGAFGIEGLAPYFIHVAATAYVGGGGHAAAKFEGYYDLLITQRLILQPQVELNLYTNNDPARRIGAGFSDMDAGLRLRYEISRKFAPYVGMSYTHKFGQTGRYAVAAGEDRGSLRFTTGIRVWF